MVRLFFNQLLLFTKHTFNENILDMYHVLVYAEYTFEDLNIEKIRILMIKSFCCKETKKIWDGVYSSKFPHDIQERALRKLRQLDASNTLEDLKNPPGNNLEFLKGDRLGQMSIRINQQWRLCFVWKNDGIYDVEIVDYH